MVCRALEERRPTVPGCRRRRSGAHGTAFPLVPTPGSTLTIRRVALRRFPYLLIHTKVATHLEVLAVAHMKRRSLYWIPRLADVEDDIE